MFFKVRFGLLTVAHEWISVLMVVSVVFHILGNLPAFNRYFTKPVALTMMAVVVLAGAVLFAMPGNQNRRPQFVDLSGTMQNTSLALAAQITDEEPEAMKTRLITRGLEIADSKQTIKDIAAANKQSVQQVLSIVLKKD